MEIVEHPADDFSSNDTENSDDAEIINDLIGEIDFKAGGHEGILDMIGAFSKNEGTNSVLSDVAILESLVKGTVKICPFDKSQLNNCSYDVRLGEFYYKQTESDTPVTPSNIHEMWSGPNRMTCNSGEHSGLPSDCNCVVLKPGETILAHTYEYIGGCRNITSFMKSKSTIARMCVSVCGDAGWGDIGYTNRWCMQIKNNNLTRDVVLVHGMKIAQIVFQKSSEPTKSYNEDGSYQSGDDFTKIMSEWKPENILPKKKFSLPEIFTMGNIE